MTSEEKLLELGEGILKAINERDYDALDQVMAPDFKDNHPGIGAGIDSREAYKQALLYAHQTMDIKGVRDVVFCKGDKMVTRVTCLGKHIGPFMGIPATGKEVAWTTIEVYRMEDGLIKERTALDDMAGLLMQLGVELPF